jgi:hypothetical protein
MPLEKQPDRQPDPVSGSRRHHGSDDFFGLDVENMSLRAQVTASLAVLVPVAAGELLVLALVPQLWWLIFGFGWMVFPAFGLLVRGVAGLSESTTELSTANSKERELLGALRGRGELTPAEAAMATSLSVTEADEMLKGLAEGGHLHVRVRGGGSPPLPVGGRGWPGGRAVEGSVAGTEGGARGIIHGPRVAAREIVSVG